MINLHIFFFFFQQTISSHSTSASQVIVPTETIFHSLDVGNFVNINVIDFNTKHALLTNHWVPPNNYILPYSIQMCKGKEKIEG